MHSTSDKPVRATVSVPLVAWRDGRPRFIPGPSTQKLGYTGEDLKHANGEWFTISECETWSQIRKAELAQKREQRDNGSNLSNIRRATRNVRNRPGSTLGKIATAFLDSPRMNGKQLIDGKRQRDALSENTAAYYRSALRNLRALDAGEFWQMDANAIDVSKILDRVEVMHGLAAARSCRAALSAVYVFAVDRFKEIRTNPVKDRTVTLPTPAPRVRYGSQSEMQLLIQCADLLGRADVGDVISLGLWTGQRQSDRLNLTGGQITQDGILFQQQKKHGQPLLIKQARPLARRLKAARLRRADWSTDFLQVAINERQRKPWTAHAYGKAFAGLRFLVATGRLPDDRDGIGTHKACRALLGDRSISNEDLQGILPAAAPMESLAGFRDQDLRDTAVTWLALAGCNKIVIASITGHSLKSIDGILSHYLGLHPDLAAQGIDQLETYIGVN